MISSARVLVIIFSGLLISACANFGGPYSSDLGGKKVAVPPVENFRGRPVIQISFLSDAEPSAEAALLNDYMEYPISTPSSNSDEDSGPGAVAATVKKADYATASTNLKAMLAKNTFYAFHLAKYFRMKSQGEVAVILNPQRLVHSSTTGYSYEPFEKNMPPFDAEISFLSYVHPATKPSNRGDVVTTFGETLAPIVSIRIDPKFNPEMEGAVALTSVLNEMAHSSDGQGARAQFVDYLNVKKYNAGNRHKLLDSQSLKKAQKSGAFKPGTYFRLELDTYDLTTKPMPPEIMPPTVRASSDYNPGSYDGYEFYNAYYKVAMSALAKVDNRKYVTESQKNYWSFYENADLEKVMLKGEDRRKRRFLMRARQTEIKYLEDRDENWMKGVLKLNNFSENFNKLRDGEQKARDEHVKAQARAVAGIFLAIGGAYASARSNNFYSQTGGVALLGVGIALVVDAMAKLDKIDVAFNSSFSTAYNSQKSYVFETAQGERVEVRAKDYADFKKQMKNRYFIRFRRDSIVVPTS